MRVSPQDLFEGQNLMRGNIGAIGEQTAAVYFTANGCSVQARNWRCRFGELDLVVRAGEYLVFVEVKTRAKGTPVSGVEAVDLHKQEKLRKAAQMYLQQNPTALQPRFDVVVVEHDDRRNFRISDHITNAF